MKKLTPLLCALFFSASTFSQTPAGQVHLVPLPKNFKWIKATKPDPATNDMILPDKIPSASSATRDLNETIIGTTQYDLQTNRSIGNRFIRNSDGTMSATWTTLCPGGISSIDRGTGYNYFDGTSWLTPDCHKIEPTNRSGWPSIAITSTGKEVVLSHSSTNGGMLLTSRTTKGTGAWTENGTVLGNFPNDTWGRMVAGGATGKTLHAIWNPSGSSGSTVCDQVSPVIYSRSTNQGTSWTISRECLDLIGSTYYRGFNADDYAIDAQGDNVAILVGDWTTDLVLLKSTDNGTTWTKTIIYQFPVPFYDPAINTTDVDGDGIGDIMNVPNGDGKVAFDKNGLIHVVFSAANIIEQFPGEGVSYYPDVDGGLWYWNETMATNSSVLIAVAQDLNGNGILDLPLSEAATHFSSGLYFGGLTQQPSIGFDDGNNIYIAYATYDELADTTAFLCGHRHVYYISSMDGGVTWANPIDIVPSIAQGGDGENQEAVFACIAPNLGDKVRIIYQRDPAPGTSLSNNTDQATWNTYENDIVYFEAPVCTVDPPQALASTVLSSTKVLLSWDAPIGASGYTVRYQSPDGMWSVHANTNSRKLRDLTPATKYVWQVRAACGGAFVANVSPWSPQATFKTDPIRIDNSESTSFFEVFPNPMSSTATIHFTLEKDSRVKIELHSLDGKKVMSVADEEFASGDNQVTLNRGSLSSGLYILYVKTDDNAWVNKIELE